MARSPGQAAMVMDLATEKDGGGVAKVLFILSMRYMYNEKIIRNPGVLVLLSLSPSWLVCPLLL